MTDSSIFNIGPHSIKQSPVKEYLPAYCELFIIAFNHVVIVQLVLLKNMKTVSLGDNSGFSWKQLICRQELLFGKMQRHVFPNC